MSKPSYIIIGKFGSTYGIHGWIKIQSFTELEKNILNYQPWYISQDQTNWKAIALEHTKQHGKGLIVKLKSYSSPESAKILTGQFIAITREQLPTLKSDEYYWSDLEGLTVIDQHGKMLGQVAYLIETGSNDVLVVKGKKEIAIPYLHGDVIVKVDLEKGELHVKWENFGEEI